MLVPLNYFGLMRRLIVVGHDVAKQQQVMATSVPSNCTTDQSNRTFTNNYERKSASFNIHSYYVQPLHFNKDIIVFTYIF